MIKKGFTLIELMVVISVIAILSTIALLGLRAAQSSAKDTKKIATIVGVQTAMERYYGDNNSSYPSSLTVAAFASYITVPITGDNGITVCAATPVRPCYTYTTGGTPATYTILFSKTNGGTLTYTNPN